VRDTVDWLEIALVCSGELHTRRARKPPQVVAVRRGFCVVYPKNACFPLGKSPDSFVELPKLPSPSAAF